METPASAHAEDDARLSFDVGPVHVTVFPSIRGRLAHFLLHRTGPALPGSVLIGSGSAHNTAACLTQAASTARRAAGTQ